MNKLTPRKRIYGWRPDLPDARDHIFDAPRSVVAKLPAAIDLRAHCSPIRDQGDLGSCTGFAIAGALEFRARALKHRTIFSPLFIYWQERYIEHTTSEDAGAEIRDGVKACVKVGACREIDWPYKIEAFRTRPNQLATADAGNRKITAYQRVLGLNALKVAVAGGQPVVFGFYVYESFESDQVAQTGVMPMPNLSTERQLGGHAVLAVGYDDKSERLIVRNSWGAGWGQKGYFTMPYGVATNPNMSDDYWTIANA